MTEQELKGLLTLQDTDLPPIRRTQANLWKAKYFELHKELVIVNRAAQRLSRKNKRLRAEVRRLRADLETCEELRKA